MKDKQQKEDFIDQIRSNYNRQSGTKTLAFVAVLIAIVVILSIIALMMI
jgi:hypothetical protein